MPTNISRITGNIIEINCSECDMTGKLKAKDGLEVVGEINSNYLKNKFDFLETAINNVEGGGAAINLSILDPPEILFNLIS